MAKTDLAEVKDQALAAYADYTDLGFEDQSSDDYSIPFLGVLQPMSPIVQVPDAVARPGMIINTVTGELYKGTEGVVFVPAATVHNFVEWRPRDAGGGFVAQYDLNDPLVVKATQGHTVGKIILPSGNELIETYSVYGLVVNSDGSFAPAVVAFTSTKIKKYKHWMTKARTIQIDVGGGRRIKAPLPAHKYRLKTTSEKNTKGQFFNFDIGFDGANAEAARLGPKDEIFLAAFDLNAMVREGQVKVAHDSQAATEGGGDMGGESEVPF